MKFPTVVYKYISSIQKAALCVAAVLAIVAGPSMSLAEPPVDSWRYVTGFGWAQPPMGGPVTKYVVDPDTGKTYLVEADYWGQASISEADLNDVETEMKEMD